MKRKEQVVQQLRSGIETLLKSHEIELVKGVATLTSATEFLVTTTDEKITIKANKIILATGSKPFMPPIKGIDLQGVIDSNDLLKIDKVPESMVIVGGGVVGLEFAVIMQSFGCQVTVVEMLSTILSNMDKDIIARLAIPLRKQKIKFLTNTKVKEFKRQGDSLAVSIESAKGEEELLAEKVLVCTGRVPVIEGLGLETVGVEYSSKGVKCNDKLQTNISNIYAIGDLTGFSMLAHAASEAGIVAAENACGKEKYMDYSNIPSCVFTIPEVAGVGITEQEALAKNMTILSSKFNFAANGKAMDLGETDGFVKIIADQESHKIGVYIMGPHASDLIMEGTVAVFNGLTAEQVVGTIHPHPTLSETVSECEQGIFTEPIHQVKMKRR